MKPWEVIAPQDTRPIGWKALQRDIAATFFTELPATLLSVGHMVSPDEIDVYQTTAEDQFHTISAAALGLERAAYERAAANGQVEWVRADTAQLHPPCLIRLNSGPWHSLTEADAAARFHWPPSGCRPSHPVHSRYPPISRFLVSLHGFTVRNSSASHR